MNLEELRDRFRAERRVRDLSVEAVAETISERLGVNISRSVLVNAELGRGVNPRPEVVEGMMMMLLEWGVISPGRVREEVADYYAGDWQLVKGQSAPYWYGDYTCSGCGQLVPGGAQGARYCLLCGIEVAPLSCHSCGARATSPDAAYCAQCGCKLAR